MYNKTAFSKNIGWDGSQMSIPNKEDLDKLYQEAKEGNSISAGKIFRLYRFCKSPTTPEETIVINSLYDMFIELFK